MSIEVDSTVGDDRKSSKTLKRKRKRLRPRSLKTCAAGGRDTFSPNHPAAHFGGLFLYPVLDK